MVLPIDSSLFAEIVPTWAIAFESLQGFESFFSSSVTVFDGPVDAALDVHRVRARGDGLEALAHDRLGEHGRGRGAVTGLVGGVGRDFLHHLRAHVLELVLELDLLRHAHAVLGDGRGAEALLEHCIAALGAQRHLDRVGQDVDAAHHAGARVIAETYVFSCHVYLSPKFCGV